MGLLDRFRRGSITGAEAVRRVRDGALLVDVRSQGEWRAGHAAPARHVPLSELATRTDRLPTGRQVVAVCHSGIRSARAAKQLRSAGFDAVSLRGGMAAWADAGGAMGKKGR